MSVCYILKVYYQSLVGLVVSQILLNLDIKFSHSSYQ
jgi:hypothetical protein